MLLGGRTAEELIFADPTTGAQNDIDRATTIARQMVTEFGMSDSLGPMRFGQPQGEVFLGRDFRPARPTTPTRWRRSIDAEVRALIDAAHDAAARRSSGQPRDPRQPGRELIEHETLEAERVQELFADVRMWDAAATAPRASSVRPEGTSRRRPRPCGGRNPVRHQPPLRRLRVTDAESLAAGARHRRRRIADRPRARSSARSARSSWRSARTPTATASSARRARIARHVRGDLRRAARGSVARTSRSRSRPTTTRW